MAAERPTRGAGLRLGSSELIAVPAWHYRWRFAAWVNELSQQRASCPDAIAVELDPSFAREATAWLAELGPGTMPVMLGLLRLGDTPNGGVGRADDATTRPPAGLRCDPDLPESASLLCLSPTDSIIEAIRCALELGVPLYALDAEQHVASRHRQDDGPLLEDPAAWPGTLGEYVARHVAAAGATRLPERDTPRERAMAAGLRYLLSRHHRVLFTGGLAHWADLPALIERVRPRVCVDVRREVAQAAVRRTVVHPVLALEQMDLYPVFTALYQSTRRPAGSGAEAPHIDEGRAVAKLVLDARREWCGRSSIAQRDFPKELWEAWAQLVRDYGLVAQTRLPGVQPLLRLARATLPPDAAAMLADRLMAFEWATPSERLPLASPAGTTKIRLLQTDGRGQGVYELGGDAGAGTDPLPVPWEWRDDVAYDVPDVGWQYVTWLPANYLTDALTHQATRVAADLAKHTTTLPFEGALLDGLDVRATVRAHARGEHRVYVCEHRRERDGRKTDAREDPYPIVFIFDSGKPDAEYQVWGFALRQLAEYVTNGAVLRRRQQGDRRYLVEAVSFGTTRSLFWRRAHRTHCTRHDMAGILLFSPSSFTPGQCAAWARRTDLSRNPLASWLGPRQLWSAVAEHSLDLRPEDWQSTLIALSLPYAPRRVTIVAPDGFQVPDSVQALAGRFGRELRLVPASLLPQGSLRSISVYHSVPIFPGPSIEYPEFVVAAMGQDPAAYRDLVPADWRSYGLEDVRPSPASGDWPGRQEEW